MNSIMMFQNGRCVGSHRVKQPKDSENYKNILQQAGEWASDRSDRQIKEVAGDKNSKHKLVNGEVAAITAQELQDEATAAADAVTKARRDQLKEDLTALGVAVPS